MTRTKRPTGKLAASEVAAIRQEPVPRKTFAAALWYIRALERSNAAHKRRIEVLERLVEHGGAADEYVKHTQNLEALDKLVAHLAGKLGGSRSGAIPELRNKVEGLAAANRYDRVEDLYYRLSESDSSTVYRGTDARGNHCVYVLPKDGSPERRFSYDTFRGYVTRARKKYPKAEI